MTSPSLKRRLLIGLLMGVLVGLIGIRADDDIVTRQNPIFNPGTLQRGTPTTWTFRTSTDNAIARVLIDSEGLHDGAVPDGYAELMLRAQDELRDPRGGVISSNDMQGHLRAASKSFGFTDDPAVGHCRGTLCPQMVELISDKHVRITASSDGVLDLVAGSRQIADASWVPGDRISITNDGVRFPDLKAEAKRLQYACLDETGKLIGRPTPCDR